MKHERYIIDEREIELLDRYEGTMNQTKDPHRYDTFEKESLADFCRKKLEQEKQIDGMAWDLYDIPKHPRIKSCEQCDNKHCHTMYYAERAYNAG